VVLGAGPHVAGEGHALDLRAGEAGADRHRVLAAEASAAHFRLGPPAAYQLHGLLGERGCPRMAPGGRAALEDQRCQPPAGQFQRGRKPGGACAGDQYLDSFFFLTAHESPQGDIL
jgi:hypothetical protein